MRTLKLEHEKVEMIENALQYYFERTQKVVQDPIFPQETRKQILKDGNRYADLMEGIRNGNYDY